MATQLSTLPSFSSTLMTSQLNLQMFSAPTMTFQQLSTLPLSSIPPMSTQLSMLQFRALMSTQMLNILSIKTIITQSLTTKLLLQLTSQSNQATSLLSSTSAMIWTSSTNHHSMRNNMANTMISHIKQLMKRTSNTLKKRSIPCRSMMITAMMHMNSRFTSMTIHHTSTSSSHMHMSRSSTRNLILRTR